MPTRTYYTYAYLFVPTLAQAYERQQGVDLRDALGALLGRSPEGRHYYYYYYYY